LLADGSGTSNQSPSRSVGRSFLPRLYSEQASPADRATVVGG